MLEAGPRPPALGSDGSASMMRLKLEMEEKKQAMVLLQRALVSPSAVTPGTGEVPHVVSDGGPPAGAAA